MAGVLRIVDVAHRVRVRAIDTTQTRSDAVGYNPCPTGFLTTVSGADRADRGRSS
jgi:hypothetical protein